MVMESFKNTFMVFVEILDGGDGGGGMCVQVVGARWDGGAPREGLEGSGSWENVSNPSLNFSRLGCGVVQRLQSRGGWGACKLSGPVWGAIGAGLGGGLKLGRYLCLTHFSRVRRESLWSTASSQGTGFGKRCPLLALSPHPSHLEGRVWGGE